MKLLKHYNKYIRSKYLKFILINLLIVFTIILYKIFIVPIYWPGGDYLNHIQNAKNILYDVHWSWGLGGYNAWWQPLGPAFFYILTGSFLFNSFYPFIFFQALMISLLFTYLLVYSKSKDFLFFTLTFFICSLIVPGLIFHIENAMHIGNFFFQSVCIILLIDELNNKNTNSKKLIFVGILLAVCNSFRSSGFPIFFFYFVIKILSQRSFKFLDKRHYLFILSYTLSNLIFGIYSNPRYDHMVKDSSCYYQFSDEILKNEFKEISNLNFMYETKNKIPDSLDSSELEFYYSKAPNFITFEFVKHNGYQCKKNKLPVLSWLKISFIGDSPPREGRQLMISIQSIPERLLRNTSQTTSFIFTKLFEEKIKSTIENYQNSIDNYSLYFPAKFSLEFYKEDFNNMLKPFIESYGLDKKYSLEELQASFIPTLLGEKTPFNSRDGLIWTIVEGYAFIKISNLSGPRVQNNIFNKTFRELISNNPILFYVFAENSYCSLVYHFSPTIKTNICGLSSFKGLKQIKTIPQFRSNVKSVISKKMADELVNDEEHKAKHNNIVFLYLIYVLSSPIIGIISLILIPLSIFLIIKHPNTRKMILFIYLILFFKILFNGALGSIGDYLRYADESRLISIILSVCLIRFFNEKRIEAKARK